MVGFFKVVKKFYRRHWFWILIILFFLATRLLALFCLEPHNDEVIYVRYAQVIHFDWSKYKYISAGYNLFNDFKEPLQYWLTSLTVSWWRNPLWGVRIWSIFFGLIGLVFTARFIKRVWGGKRWRGFLLF